MLRRQLLKGAVALPLLGTLPAALRAAGQRRRLHPADPGWPDEAKWQALNNAVGGTLQRVEPLFAPCAAADSAACSALLKNLRNPFFIADQAGGTQVSGWLDAWTPAASVYAVKARTAADVAAAVNFARVNNLRLAIKGTGHSYQGTSCAADSLLVWTRAMNKVTVHEAFTPNGCAGKAQPLPAVSAEAGAVWIDLYDAVTTQAGRYVQGGGCTSVGVAGLIQSGGFGSFSKGFGSAAANLIEAEVVTADGVARLANACTNPELFWALKGGGGGSFGVITRLTLRTHALPEFFGGARGKIQARSDESFRRLLARFFAFYAERLANPHWGEQVAIGEDNTLRISMVCQGLAKGEPERIWQPFFEWVMSAPAEFTVSDRLRARALEARSWWQLADNPSMIRDSREGAPPHRGWWEGDQDQVGAYLHAYDSLWLPAALLAPAQQPRLVTALFAGSRHKEIGLHFNKGLAGAPPEAVSAALDTATHPAVTQAFALAIIADGEKPAYPGMPGAAIDQKGAHADADAIARATAELARVTPSAGSYVSESNYFNAHWAQAFWGPNYPRLRQVKAKYDPDGLFIVHHGVGSEDWSADGFTFTG